MRFRCVQDLIYIFMFAIVKGGDKPPECRIHISMEGFEWFMYNKTAATDSILEHLMSSDPEARRLGAAKSRESTFVAVNQPPLEEEPYPLRK